ncbi:hypothetical protein ACHAXR_000987, partial [Thalassiosira sp. AJA248-18]
MKISPISLSRRHNAAAFAQHDDADAGEQKHAPKSLHRFAPKIFSTRKVRVEDLSEKLVPIIGTAKFATVIHNLFTPEECANLIVMTESEGYEEALVHGAAGSEVLRKDLRNSGRCIMDDDALSSAWFQRVMQALEGTPVLKEKLVHAKYVGDHSQNKEKCLHVCGLNERLRFLRYFPGQYFNVHQDNFYTRGPEFGKREGETSYLTFILYLSDHMKGGETRFEDGGRWLDVVPEVGSVLVFDHDIYHKAMPVVAGKKYCCRSDFMYS